MWFENAHLFSFAFITRTSMEGAYAKQVTLLNWNCWTKWTRWNKVNFLNLTSTDMEDWMDRNSPPWFRANLHVFKMYLLCIFKIEMYLYSGALKIGGAGVKRGRQIEFMWFLSCWDLGVDLLRGPLGTSAPAYPDLCGLSRHNVGFHIFYPSLNMARLGYKKET